MIYKIVHRTTYRYKHSVSMGSHVASLRPRSLPRHRLEKSELQITPSPAVITERIDYFGNHQYFFTIEEPHEELIVESRSRVVMAEASTRLHQLSPSWEEIVKSLPEDFSPEASRLISFGLSRRGSVSGRSSPICATVVYARRPICREPARSDDTNSSRFPFRFQGDHSQNNHRRSLSQEAGSLPGLRAYPNRLPSLHQPARTLCKRLSAHISAARSAALVGADASHAWVSAFCPGLGWIDVDPTNDVVPSTGHVTIAWGRDFGDVSPLHGLILGGGAHTLNVGVDLEAIES